MLTAIPTDTLDHDTVRESLEYIVANLRPSDAAEVKATTSEDPFWALMESQEGSSASWLIVDDTGLPVGIFGVAPHFVPQVGIAWLIGTPGLEDEAYSFLRQTRQYISEMHLLFPVLWANVDFRNSLTMRWLDWAGFQVTDVDPAYGPEKRLFVQFVRSY
jgi:hypothetical protein